jgi:very-short-patch-repair endonuclease
MDFYLPQHQVAIEVDGRQHIDDDTVFPDMTAEERKKRDVQKMKTCLRQNIGVIRVLQEDVWQEKYDWRTLLKDEIRKFPPCRVVFLDPLNTGSYEGHRSLWNDE